MRKLNLRTATNSDLVLTYRIKTNSIKPYVEKIWSWNEAHQWEIHKDNFIASDIKIIELKQQGVGYLVVKETDKQIIIENLLIDKDFQNLGIGKVIIQEIIQRANSETKEMRLQVFKINTKAQKFYQSLGFEKTSEKEHHIEMKKSWISIKVETPNIK